MKRNQPPLLDDLSGAELKSPIFAPRPGWGGQLRHWFAEGGSLLLFRLALAIALVLILVALIRQPSSPAETRTISDNRISVPPVTIGVRSGDGMYALAMRAIDWYTASHGIRLDEIERIGATDSLVNLTGPHQLKPGQVVDFDAQNVAAAINYAQNLSPTQRQNLEPYLGQ